MQQEGRLNESFLAAWLGNRPFAHSREAVAPAMTMQHFDSSGNEVSRVDYRADERDMGRDWDVGDVLDRGIQPDFDKDDLDGENVRIVGIKGPEAFQLGPVYFVLLTRAEHPEGLDPYGVMFAASSPIIAVVLQMAERKHLPFRAKLVKVASRTNRGFEYWQMQKPDAPAPKMDVPKGKAPTTPLASAT